MQNDSIDDHRTDRQILQALGLSKNEAIIYLSLTSNPGWLNKAGLLGPQLEMASSSMYRALHNLEQKGFVTSWRIIQARRYRPIAIKYALDAYAEYQRNIALPLIKQQRDQEAINA